MEHDNICKVIHYNTPANFKTLINIGYSEGAFSMRLKKSVYFILLILFIPVFVPIKNVESKPRAVAMIVEGNYGYIMLLDDVGLYIVNLSDPSNPEFVSHLKLAGYSVSDMCVDNNYVYISCQLDYNPAQFAVHIIDVSTPEEPELVKTYVHSTQYFAYEICASNDLLFLVVNDILRIVDVSTPSTPFEIGFYSSHSVYGIYVDGNRAYITCGDDGLKILDINTPNSPTLLGEYIASTFYSLYVDGNYAFTDLSGTVYRFDVTNPAAIIPAGNYAMDYYATIRVSDSFLYYIQSSSLHIIDFTTVSPSLESSYYIGYGYYNFDVHGNYVYCLSEEIKIIDTSDTSDPIDVGSFKLWFPSIRTRNIILGAVALTIVATMIGLIVWRRDKIKANLERSRAQRVKTTPGKMHKAVKISLIASVAFFVASIVTIIGVQSWDFWTGIPICLSLGPISIAVLCLGPLITWVVVQAKKKSAVPPAVISPSPPTEVKREKQEGKVFCPSCGVQNNAEWKHCSKCGYKL